MTIHLSLLQLCFISTCGNTLFNANQLKRIKLLPRRGSHIPYRTRKSRGFCAPASPSRGKRRRPTPELITRPDLLNHVSRSFALARIASKGNLRASANSIDRAAVELMFARDIMAAPPAGPAPSLVSDQNEGDNIERPSTACSVSTVPSSLAQYAPSESGITDDFIETRSIRSGSCASHNPNRLSLTLPLAINPSLPTTYASSVASSVPPTPVDSPGVGSFADSRDFIAAIAAQEQRVLDMREELSRAERDLRQLKKAWSSHEATRRRKEDRGSHRMRQLAHIDTSAVPDDDDARRRTIELDRRKALLLGQQSTPGSPGSPSTPNSSRRRVFTGSHTRTLSLLSPTKSDISDFSVHEDPVIDQLKTSSRELDETFARPVNYSSASPSQLSKRASWAPRTSRASPVRQIADEFRSQLWTFVEDLRQATVGDEPITGQGTPLRSSLSITSFADEQETIRAQSTTSARPHVASVFEQSPTPASRFSQPLQEDSGNTGGSGRKQSAAKRFSFQPLSADSFDDTDWTNWDSPPTKSPRWSGTTLNGDEAEETTESTDGRKAKQIEDDVPDASSTFSSPKVDELAWPTLKSLHPTKLKKHATEFMKEWEKSLSPPGATVNSLVYEDSNRVRDT